MKKIKAYKAFDKDLKCLGFQFEIGKSYHEENVSICESGFHSCENPFDVLNYYDLTECRFAEVEVFGKIKKHKDDSKIASSDITIIRELSLSEFISVVWDYIYNNIKDVSASGSRSQLAASGNWSQLAASGNGSQFAASGNWSQLAASGNGSKLAASGNGSQLAASGYRSKLAASGGGAKLAASGNWSQLAASGNGAQLAASGDGAQLAASGDRSKLAASGYGSQLAASGDRSKLAASGDRSKLEVTGQNSVAANIGINGKVKAAKGTWITLAEYDDNYICVCVKSAKVDGELIKADTWYMLKNGEFTEC